MENVNFPCVEARQIGAGLVQTVDARDLHAALKPKTDFSDWIKRRIKDAQLEEGLDFTSLKIEERDVRTGQIAISRIDYFLTLDAGKELAMLERNAIGRSVRKYFIECERRAATRIMSPAEILMAQAQAMIALEQGQAAIIAEQERQADALAATAALAARQEERLNRIETASDWFTALGYARWTRKLDLNLKDAGRLGRAASRKCKDLGFEPSPIPDPRFGVVNQYPKQVLDDVWSEVFDQVAH